MVTKLRTPLHFETAFARYKATEVIGEGGAGRVYGAVEDGDGGQSVAIKVLHAQAASLDKRKRFKNEIGFLTGVDHRNLVRVLGSGMSTEDGAPGPFYVMPRYKR